MGIGRSITNENGMFANSRVNPRKVSQRAGLVSNLRTPRRKLFAALLAVSITAIVAVAVVPVPKSSATPTREGGGCNGCHGGAQTPSMMTVTGLPSGSYTPGLQYTIVVTITDTNGATGENNFDLISNGGTFTTSDPNAEINSATEASANDGVTPMRATSWTVVWTAPSSGSVQIDIWAVMGDGATGTNDIWDHESYTYSAIPEFPFVVLPVVGVIGILMVVSRASKKHQ